MNSGMRSLRVKVFSFFLLCLTLFLLFSLFINFFKQILFVFFQDLKALVSILRQGKCPLLLFQTTPLLTMCVAYFSIWIKRKSTMGIQNHRAARESKLANTLFLVTGASLLTWTPFQVFNNLLSFDRLRISLTLLYLSRILQFSNSLVNVIIYPLRIPQFKTTFKNIIHYCGAVSQRPTTARSQPAVPLNRITQLRC